jgi:hypothetical protein
MAVLVVSTVEVCPRCDREHRSLSFRELGAPVVCAKERFTYWAICPNTQEPVLGYLVQDRFNFGFFRVR